MTKEQHHGTPAPTEQAYTEGKHVSTVLFNKANQMAAAAAFIDEHMIKLPMMKLIEAREHVANLHEGARLLAGERVGEIYNEKEVTDNILRAAGLAGCALEEQPA